MLIINLDLKDLPELCTNWFFKQVRNGRGAWNILIKVDNHGTISKGWKWKWHFARKTTIYSKGVAKFFIQPEMYTLHCTTYSFYTWSFKIFWHIQGQDRIKVNMSYWPFLGQYIKTFLCLIVVLSNSSNPIQSSWILFSTYDKVSEVVESWVQFASKTLTPRRMHLNGFQIDRMIAECHCFPNMHDML